MSALKAIPFLASCCFLSFNTFSQEVVTKSYCEPPATIIVFRTFNIFGAAFSYNLFFGDSLLGRIHTHDVFIIETYDLATSFHATTKAPSLNADKRTNYKKVKTIKYPITLKQGDVYLVKCNFLNQRVFEYPRQPTIRLIKKNEMRKYLKKRFVKKNIKTYLYNGWMEDKGLDKYLNKPL